VDETSEKEARARSLEDAIAAIRGGDLAVERLSRLSDLSRDGARTLASEWLTIPEPTREELVRRCEALGEERVELGFGRAMRVALSDPSPVVRQLAVSALWEDESRAVFEQLRTLFDDDPSPDVRASAAAALERFAGQAAAGTLSDDEATALRVDLLRAVNDPATPYAVQRRALEALGPLGAQPDVAAAIAEAYESGDHGLQSSAVYAMGRTLDPRWLPAILNELESDDAELRYEAARAAAALSSTDALPSLLAAASDEDAEVRHMAIAAIGQIGGRGAVRALERLSEDAGEADLELIEAAREEASLLLEPFQEAR
jgi:HEAT repeat protein